MNKTVFLYYNGMELRPESEIKNHAWEHYRNGDSAKLALFAAGTWRDCGWNVRRLRSDLRSPISPGFSFSGRLADSAYPLELWDFWHYVPAPCWVTTIDVYNRYFYPEDADKLSAKADSIGIEAVAAMPGYTHSTMFVTPAYVNRMIEAILAYDAGGGEDLPGDLVSDETIGRHRLRSFWHGADLMKYALAEHEWETAPLFHFPKSCLQHMRGFDAWTADAVLCKS